MSKIIFELKGVHFSYLGKFPALCGIDIVIRQGQKIAVIGANGSGKSTLLHLLDGLIFPDKGTIRAFGSELKESDFNDQGFSRNFRLKVGLVFQNPDVQLFCPTVKEDILFGPLQLGVAKQEIKKRLDEVLSILKIDCLLDRPPHRLSIGEKRKIAIASVLMINPDILILDEPTSGLDPLTTRHIIDLVIQANRQGKTIIISTHDLHIVEEVSEIVYVFSQDKLIVRSGPANMILEDAALLSANNLAYIHSHKHTGKTHVHAHQHIEYH
jgi:cobalt/nickel transport system ATP-binding protein